MDCPELGIICKNGHDSFDILWYTIFLKKSRNPLEPCRWKTDHYRNDPIGIKNADKEQNKTKQTYNLTLGGMSRYAQV